MNPTTTSRRAASIALCALTSLTLLLLLALPVTAGAIHSPAGGTLAAIGDATSGDPVAYSEYDGGLIARDLYTGSRSTLALPANYASWNDTPIAGLGYYAGIALAADGQSYNLFITGASGLRNLANWPRRSGSCRTSERPLAIFPNGALIALRLVTEPASTGRGCAVDAAGTKLLKYSADGSAETLWLPADLLGWLPRGSVSVYGTRLAVSHPARGSRSGRLEVYDFRSKKTLYKRRIGGGFTAATMTAMYGLTVFYKKGGRVAARHISTYLRHSSRVYSGRAAGLIACGDRVAIAGRGSFELRGPHGKRLYRRAYLGDYAETTVVCSANALHYTIWPNYPESDPDGTNPPVNATKRSRTLDLTGFQLG